LIVDQDSLEGVLWIDKWTSRAKSFSLSDVTAFTVSPDFKTITYKANINLPYGRQMRQVIQEKINLLGLSIVQ
jgi:hypothetical protein